MKKVLITGGAGFIGSHLAEHLLGGEGAEVFVIDNLSSGSLDNIAHLQENPGFHLVVDTILNEAVMNELIFKCQEVYHLAAAVGVRLIMEKPVETLETNVKGTEMVLRLANRHKRKVLISSTSEVYGKLMGRATELGALAEDADLLMGATSLRRWAYACSKALDEFFALAYFDEKKLPVVVARLFNIVGPRQTGEYGMVLPNFVKRALLRKPIEVHGDGQQKRSFTHVKDAVRALVKLMNTEAALGQVVNIGSEEEITIEGLANRVKEMTASPSPVEFVSYEKAYGPGFEDMMRRLPDLAKARELIGYEPSFDLDATIKSVIDYFKK